ncbi:MAG: AAA family ATPase [Pirellulales bacterium]|nr:AAA family ATPase [Pirellulales bacterium]
MTDRRASDLSPRPFVAAPDASRYFPAVVFEEARHRIARSIERGEGPALLVGGAGIGKTMLVEVLAEQFRGSMAIAHMGGAQLCTRRALLQMILFHTDLPYRGLDEGELRLSLLDFLRPNGEPARRLLLLVDEAESLPDRLLEELRVLTNVADAGHPLVSLVLVGTSILEERFADPKLEAFSQRISTRSYLAPLGREETLQYIKAQVAAVEKNPDAVFTDEGLEAMFAATDGVPRLINQLGDQLFWLAGETGYAPLDADFVQQAWSESQQLPAPWNNPPAESTGSPVEFGDLALDEMNDEELIVGNDDPEDDMPASIPIGSPSISSLPASSIEMPTASPLEAAENLLQQLDYLEQAKVAPESVESSGTISVQNPFLEEFDSEELVFDRYSGIESQILSSAQRVVNRNDTTFGPQLRQFEIVEAAAVTVDTEFASPEFASPESAPSLEDVAAYEATNVAGCDSPETDAGELLVVEDPSGVDVDVVSGKHFRQLFSSLQRPNSMTCPD